MSKTKAAGTDLTVVSPSAVPSIIEQLGLTDVDPSLIADAAGHEKQTLDRQDVAQPFLRILQDLSPQVKRHLPTYVEGSAPGMFFHSTTGRLWDGNAGILVVPVYFTKSLIEWKPNRAGFVAEYPYDAKRLAACTRDDKGYDVLPSGNLLVPTVAYFLLIVNEETGETLEAVLPLQRSQLKASKDWNAKMIGLKITNPQTQETFTPPFYFRTYRLTTTLQQKEQNSWFGLKVEPSVATAALPKNGRVLFLAAQEAAKALRQGDRNISLAGSFEEEVVETSHEQGTGDDEAPF